MHLSNGTAQNGSILAVNVYQIVRRSRRIRSQRRHAGVSVCCMLKSVFLAVTYPPISTKLFSSSKEAILVLAKFCAVLLILSALHVILKCLSNFCLVYSTLFVSKLQAKIQAFLTISYPAAKNSPAMLRESFRFQSNDFYKPLYFTAPVIPSVKLFWKKKNTIAVGSVQISTPSISIP